MATYYVSPVKSSERFEQIKARTPDFIMSEFYDLAKGSDFWFKHVEGIDSDEALSVLMGLIEDNLSDKKINSIMADVEHCQIHNEVERHFAAAETELEGWQGFEAYLERNEAQWAYDEKMALYRNEY